MEIEPTAAGTPGRRTAIKGFVGAGVAAAVWSEPTIKGLVSRPAYAAAVSGFPNPATIVLEVTMPIGAGSPMITSVNNLDPFGHGPLNFQTDYNTNNNRYRIRLDPTQSGGNAGAVLDMGTVVPDDGTYVSPIPNSSGRLRWRTGASGLSYTLTLTVSCA